MFFWKSVPALPVWKWNTLKDRVCSTRWFSHIKRYDIFLRKTVKINITEKKNTYLVEIIDTGKGIDKENLKLIWSKYYKNEKNHQRNVVGTGLGLSIVKEVLTKHKFNYGVKSKKGKGSNFYFEIDKAKIS